MCYFCVLLLDSDSDNFQSLKKVSKTKQNGTAKPTKSEAEGARGGAQVGIKSPVRPLSTQSKAAVKSPVTPKSAAPPQPKQTPTSVFDYFGNAAIQRSDKKLVASTKRKAVSITSCLHSLSSYPLDLINILHWLYENSSSSQPTQEADDLSDEQIARALQMDEDMEVGCLRNNDSWKMLNAERPVV